MLSGNSLKNRLNYEHEQMKKLKNDSPFFDFAVVERPAGGEPEKYQALFTCKGIVGIDGNKRPIAGENHSVLLYLHDAFPIKPPKFTWETPIWHPNINHKTGEVCINVWTPVTTLYQLCMFIGEMIMYKRFFYTNTVPFPLPASAEEVKWCAWAVERGLIPPPNQKGFDTREFLYSESAVREPKAEGRVKVVPKQSSRIKVLK